MDPPSALLIKRTFPFPMCHTMTCLHLLDMHPDLIFYLLRNYIPLEDKVGSLWTIPEFRPYLEDRAAWRTTSKHVSIPFLIWLQSLQSGWWYLESPFWYYQIFLKVDFYAMTLSVHHYILEHGHERLKSPILKTGDHPSHLLKKRLPILLDDFLMFPSMTHPSIT